MKYYIEIEGGITKYYRDAEFTVLHREDGPAIERVSGGKAWYINGNLHRTDGPAVECDDGDKHWYINGKLHREDGPAVEFAGGCTYWFNGVRLTEAEFNARTVAPCVGKVIEIDGVKYKLTVA